MPTAFRFACSAGSQSFRKSTIHASVAVILHAMTEIAGSKPLDANCRISKPSRWRIGYRLRTLMILLTAICVGLGWWANSSQQQAQWTAAIRNAGGFVAYHNDGWTQKWRIADQFNSWLGHDYLHSVEYVGGGVDENVPFEQFTQHHRIIIDSPWDSTALYQIENEPRAIEVFQKTGKVRRLYYAGPMTAELLQRIGSLPLEYLGLQSYEFPHEGAAHLATLQRLKELVLFVNIHPDELFTTIAKLESLESLSFWSNTPVPTAEEIRKLRFLRNLKTLKFFGGYTPELIRTLSQDFPQLETLGLGNLMDTNWVAPLANHPSLKTIEIHPISVPAIEKVLPNVTVIGVD